MHSRMTNTTDGRISQQLPLLYGFSVATGERQDLRLRNVCQCACMCMRMCMRVCVYASVFACVPFYVHASVRVRPVCVYTCVGVKGHCKRLPRIDWRLTLSAD